MVIKFRNNIPEVESTPLKFNGVEIISPIVNGVPRATLNLGDILVVIYNYPGGSFKDLTTANAFAFDRTGRVIWTVEPYGPYQELAKDHYIHFDAMDDSYSQIILGTFIGRRAFLNTDNGKITRIPVGRPW